MLSFILALAVLGPSSAREQFEALKAEYDAKEADWNRRYTGGETRLPEEKIDYEGRFRDYPAWSYAPKFLAFAEAHPGDPAGVDALFWLTDLISSVGDHNRDLAPSLARALEILGRSHVDDPRVDALCRSISFSGGMPASEEFLRVVSERAASRDVRGRAWLGHARLLIHRREMAIKPWFEQEGNSKVGQLIVDRFDPAYLRSIREADPNALLDEIEREFDLLAKEYSDVLADSRPTRDQIIGRVVEDERFGLIRLGLGQVAPDIAGLDSDDRPFKLSDYRGKVVVLTFSGNWCGPCVGMYPGERALVERYKDRPFAILSVNTDTEKETLRKSIKVGDITWRCWWDGSRDGPITSSWNVRSFPTVYLLDAAGVIRDKQLRGEQLDAAVAKLMEQTAPGKP
jgi:thiol-disulfide isomerase/thioredoxin